MTFLPLYIAGNGWIVAEMDETMEGVCGGGGGAGIPARSASGRRVGTSLLLARARQ